MVGKPEQYRRLVEEVAALYDWIDARQKEEPGRAGRCDACGACCDFSAYDHRLFVTPPELIYLAAKLGAEHLNGCLRSSAGVSPVRKTDALQGQDGPATHGQDAHATAKQLLTHPLKPMPGGRCPYQEGNECTVHGYRFVGCRIFCCHGDPDWQSELSEMALKRLKTICDEFQLPYRYQDLAAAIDAFTTDTCRWAGAPCPADRAG